MKKQITILKLTCLAATVAMVTVGCATSGQARVDTDDDAMGAAGKVEVGTDADADIDVDVDRSNLDRSSDIHLRSDLDRTHYRSDSHLRSDADLRADVDENDAAAARATVSALSFVPETRPEWINRFGMDWAQRMQTIEVYTFRVPDLDLNASDDLPQFSANLPVGSAYVEAAGGSGEVSTRRVIQHSPNPIR
jgi:hypothetical protein